MSSHNLSIESYTFYELLELFGLDPNGIDTYTLKKARSRVLQMHPDKSKLPKEYFIFYKKAFEIIVRVFENQNKVNQHVPTNEEILYSPENPHAQIDKKQLQKTIDTMNPGTFNNKFNELFESHAEIKRENKNEWFSEHNEEEANQVRNKSEMDAAFEQYKQKQHAMVQYTGVVPLSMNGGTSGLYEEDNDSYITADVFSKLKFDDLRKVHKDQTVFNVSEQQYNSVPQYKSVDHYVRSREQQCHEPLQKQQAEHQLRQEKIKHEKLIQQKQYNSQLQSARAHEKSQNMLANFLRIAN